MPIIVRCARCEHVVELEKLGGTYVCPSCGARYDAAELAGISHDIYYFEPEQSGLPYDATAVAKPKVAPAVDSPKSRMLAAIDAISLDDEGVAPAMRAAIATCIDQICDGSRNHSGELGALLDAGRSYAVASFGIWNELRSRVEALEVGTPEHKTAEFVADEVLCAGDAGILAVIRGIDDVRSHEQRLEPFELEALVNLWQTVHDFNRYPLSDMEVKGLCHGYGLYDGLDKDEAIDLDKAPMIDCDLVECAEGGNAPCTLYICESILRAAPDHGYARIMADVSRGVIACDTVVATTHFRDLDDVVRQYIVALRGDEDPEAEAEFQERLQRAKELTETRGDDFSLREFFDVLLGDAGDEYDEPEFDYEALDKRSMALRELALSLEGLIKGIVDHTQRVLDDCEGGLVSLSEEVVSRVRAQHDDAAGSLSRWMLAITRELEDMFLQGLEFEDDWEVAVWKHIFLAVEEQDRDEFWRVDYDSLKDEYEAIVQSLQNREEEIHHTIADTSIALDQKVREIDKAFGGDPAVLERLRAEASMIEYDMSMLTIELWDVQERFETRDWDELSDEDM